MNSEQRVGNRGNEERQPFGFVQIHLSESRLAYRIPSEHWLSTDQDWRIAYLLNTGSQRIRKYCTAFRLPLCMAAGRHARRPIHRFQILHRADDLVSDA